MRKVLATLLMFSFFGASAQDSCHGTFAYDCATVSISTYWSPIDFVNYPMILIDEGQNPNNSLMTFFFDLNPILHGFVTPQSCAIDWGTWPTGFYSGWRYFTIDFENLDPSCKKITYDIYTCTEVASPLVHCMTYVFVFRKRWEKRHHLK